VRALLLAALQGADVGTQYRAGIYTHTPEQLEEASKYLEEKRAAMKGVKIVTECEPVKSYWKAEVGPRSPACVCVCVRLAVAALWLRCGVRLLAPGGAGWLPCP
jgi:hypothetical protein